MSFLCKVFICFTSIALFDVHAAAKGLSTPTGKSEFLRRNELNTHTQKLGRPRKKEYKFTADILEDLHLDPLKTSEKNNDRDFEETVFQTDTKTEIHIRNTRQANNNKSLNESEMPVTTEAQPDVQTTLTNDIVDEYLPEKPQEEEDLIRSPPENVSQNTSTAIYENQNNLYKDTDSLVQDGGPEKVLQSENSISNEVHEKSQSEVEKTKMMEEIENVTSISASENIEEETTARAPISIINLSLKSNDSVTKDTELYSPAYPDPITGIQVDDVEKPFEYITDVREEDPEFLSYDINVGASLTTGNASDTVVGVGQVIPVQIDIHEPAHIPSTTVSTTTKTTVPQKSLLDTFLNLFVGGSLQDKRNKEKVMEDEPPIPPPPPPFETKPPPFKTRPPPLPILRPPPLKETLPEQNIAPKIDEEIKNEVDPEFDYEAKPTIQNEVKTRPILPTIPSITRNELPIRRRPFPGKRPSRPGIFETRPNFSVLNPLVPTVTGATKDEKHSDQPAVIVPEEEVKDKRPANNETVLDSNAVPDEPTLPPSLPNLQIIPFVAADALVNRGSPPTENEKSGFTPRPFGPRPSQECREGGKVWKSGEMVAKGDDDPCVLCRCFLGKVVCQRLECPKIPEGCHKEQEVKAGECCPKIICDKSANVSIVDTLPNFRPLESEDDNLASKPIQPSAFAHQNRRPPFASANVHGTTTPLKIPKPFSAPRKPILPPRLRPQRRPSNKQKENTKGSDNDKEEASKRTIPRRPVISRPQRPLRIKPPSLPGEERPRPYSTLIRTGTRPPFIPPRIRPTIDRTKATTNSKTTPFESTVQASTSNQGLLSTTSLRNEEHTTSPKEFSTTQTPKTPHLFENIFENLATIEQSLPTSIYSKPSVHVSSLPTPNHSKPSVHGMIGPIDSNKPFVFPPDILLPKPLPPSSPQIDDELLNLVHQENFNLPQDISSHSAPGHVRVSKPSFKPLPEIPEAVKAQLPLGNDPILVSGLLELGGCNVYGRMFEVGAKIHDISGKCKACRCTKVGVQCLPFC